MPSSTWIPDADEARVLVLSLAVGRRGATQYLRRRSTITSVVSPARTSTSRGGTVW